MSISSAIFFWRLSAGFAHRLFLTSSAAVLPALLSATDLTIDFGKELQSWDGFGANYVETRHTRDYAAFAQDYGGFKYLNDAEREQVVDLVFGDNGLRVSLLKVFLDPFHEKNNDNDDPLKPDVSKFDHETTTRWIRYFARRGLEKTRARGDDLTVLVGLYGPPAWMSRQETFRGRDLKPDYEAEVAEYLAVFARHLRDVEGLPVKYISMHNEGEARVRWMEDGRDHVSQYSRDYNMWWPDYQIVNFLKVARGVLNAHGLPEVGITSGETAKWRDFHEHKIPRGTMRNAQAIRNDPAALANLDLITSHGFVSRVGGSSERLPFEPRGVRMLREARPELHAWTTSSTWGKMDVEIVEDSRRLCSRPVDDHLLCDPAPIPNCLRVEHDGVEFGYERQLPKTDKTVKDVYYRGALGTGMIQDQSRMRRWVAHRIEVDGQTIRWFQDDTKMLEGEVTELKRGGYFGIRHKYDRGTRYDDVRISLMKSDT